MFNRNTLAGKRKENSASCIVGLLSQAAVQGVLFFLTIQMERFWIGDYFIDVQAKQLSIYAQMVFIALSRYANKDGETFVGVRKIAGVLGINKDTVSKAVKELVVSGLVGHCKTGKHRVSGLKLSSVRPDQFPVSDRVGPKEVFKEYIKEEKISDEDRIRAEEIKIKLRAKFGWKKNL